MNPSSRPIRSYKAAVDFLLGRINYERAVAIPRTFKLDRMRALAERVGNPHQGLPVVHIAGSKGKGSTARFLAEILTASGYRTGLYTSPHLERVEERIWMNGSICSPEELTQLTDQIAPAVLDMDDDVGGANGGPTYFEIVTAMAMLHFRRRHVDMAVLEVGLGGRLDSTNICEPVCCVITNISLDHTKQLGSNVRSIATEKAGIIKPGIPIVCGVSNLEDEAAEVIQSVAHERTAPLIQFERDYRVTKVLGSSTKVQMTSFDMEIEPCSFMEPLHNFSTRMLGNHQVTNAATAVATCDVLNRSGWPISVPAMRQAVQATQVPARIEVININPPVILDTAHNEASIRALVEAVESQWPSLPKTVVFGTTRGKQIKPMLELLLNWCDRLILTRYLTNPRSCEPVELMAVLSQIANPEQLQNVSMMESPLGAWAKAEPGRGNRLICVTGSFFLAGELRTVVRQWAKHVKGAGWA